MDSWVYLDNVNIEKYLYMIHEQTGWHVNSENFVNTFLQGPNSKLTI